MATIIVVEDDVLFRNLHHKFISGLGHEVLLAANADEALILLRDNPQVALVITDIKMPRKNGIELIEEIAETKPDLPILVCSGVLSVKEEVKFFHGYRNVAFVEKPVDMDFMEVQINKMLEIKKHLDASSS